LKNNNEKNKKLMKANHGEKRKTKALKRKKERGKQRNKER
jgi:hypothetical protein